MPWPTRSQRLKLFSQANAAANTRYTVFTVPSGKVWLVKAITIYHTASGTNTFYGWHYDGSNRYVCLQQIIPVGGCSVEPNTRVFHAGDSFELQCGTALSGGRFDVCVYGAQLS